MLTNKTEQLKLSNDNYKVVSNLNKDRKVNFVIDYVYTVNYYDRKINR